MAFDDSERAHARRWIEHARNPDAESTPRAADATDAGEIQQERRLGLLGIELLKEEHRAWAQQLTKRSGHLRQFGSELRERIEFDALPTRIEIRKEWAAKGRDPDELSAREVGDRRLKAGVNQLSETQLREAVNQLIDVEETESSTQNQRQRPSRRDLTSRGKPPYSKRRQQGHDRRETQRDPMQQER